jgi:HK97 family phage prohead protease
MRLRDRWARLVRAAELQPAPAGRASFSVNYLNSPWNRAGVYVGVTSNERVSRDEALSVPAVLRGRNLICGSLAALPLRCVDGNLNPVRLPLLEQIDPFVPNVVTLAQTFEDLFFEGVSWWKITRQGAGGFPTGARHLDVKSVSTEPPPDAALYVLPSGEYPNGAVWVQGEPVRSELIIRFDSPLPPLLVSAARAIRRALKLEQAADLYATDPRPLDYFRPSDGADPAEDEEIEDILNNWADARRRRSTGYVPASLEYNAVDVMSPAELQLAELQQRATLALANAMGIDPEDLGVSTTSRTYQNAVDRRQDRINETYSVFLAAVSHRLSMGDVTPRGKRVLFDLDGFLKADPLQRWTTYQIASGIGAIDVDEIRREEDLPPLTEAQRKAIEARKPQAPAPTDTPQRETAVPNPKTSHPKADPKANAVGNVVALRLSGELVTFDAAADTTFAVDPERRTITGLCVPYGPVARSGFSSWRFQRGSLQWVDAKRVKLLVNHDPEQAIGYAAELHETDAGLVGTFKVARVPEGDRALQLAEDGVFDGLSVGVDFPDSESFTVDPTDPDVRLVLAGRLRETSLCPIPAFDGARVERVRASSTSERNHVMPCSTCGQVHAPGTPCATAATTTVQATAAPVAPVPSAAPAPVNVTTQVPAEFAAAVQAFTAAVERLGAMPDEHRETVPATPIATVREPLAYSLNGMGASFVRDAWCVRTGEGTAEEVDAARSRLRKYEAQTAELQLAATQRAAFANTGNTTDQASIIPPQYRPDLYVGQIPQGRPLHEAMSRGTIANANPFTVPVWVGSSSLSGTNSEMTGPSTGTITNHTLRTVTPTAQSGRFDMSRELVDSSNPAIDMIALNAMREEYSQDTEAVIATALANATDDNTAGVSTEGCYVYTAVGDGLDLAQGLRLVWGEFPFHRYTVAPDRVLLSRTGFGAMVQAQDGMGRPLFPFSNPQNNRGTVGVAAQSLSVDGLDATPAWGLTNGTDDVVTFNHVDAWAWESPLLTFRFEEVAGPHKIVLALWGYFAFQILRYPGIHAIAYTGA